MKKSRIDLRMEDELYQAIQEVAAAEGKTMTGLVLPVLRDVFLHKELVRIPIVGYIVDNEQLGNVVRIAGDKR